MPPESPYDFEFSWITELLSAILNLITTLLNPFLAFAVPVIAETFGVKPDQIEFFLRILGVILGTMMIVNVLPDRARNWLRPDMKQLGLAVLFLCCLISWNEFNIQDGTLKFMEYGLNTTPERAFIPAILPSVIQWVGYLTNPAKGLRVIFEFIVWGDVLLTTLGYGIKRGYEPFPYLLSIRNGIHPILTDLFMAILFNHVMERVGVWSIQELVSKTPARKEKKKDE